MMAKKEENLALRRINGFTGRPFLKWITQKFRCSSALDPSGSEFGYNPVILYGE